MESEVLEEWLLRPKSPFLFMYINLLFKFKAKYVVQGVDSASLFVHLVIVQSIASPAQRPLLWLVVPAHQSTRPPLYRS
jgi:hypothetical protein